MLVILSESFSGGGAERVLSLLANSWRKSEGVFRIISLSSDNMYLRSGVYAEVYNSNFFSNKKLNRLYNIFLALKSIKSGSNVIICSYFLLLTLTPFSFLKNYKIIFRPSIDYNYIRSEVLTRLGHFLGGAIIMILNTSLRYCRLIYQTPAIEKSFNNIIGSNTKCKIIPNPVSFDLHSFPAYQKPEHLLPLDILLVGRLVPEKGFDRLIDSLKNYAGKVRLHLYGDGSDRNSLINKAKEYQIDLITYGFSNLRDINIKAGLLIVPSRLEGFPNVVLEAALAGWPIIISSEVNECIIGSPVASLCEVKNFDDPLILDELIDIINKHSVDDMLSMIFDVRERHSIDNFKNNLRELF